MMEEFKNMLRKKMQEQGGPKENARIKAKASMAKELSDELGKDITENIKPTNVKKITVASDSEEGLKEGLEKAEEVIEGDSDILEDSSPKIEDLSPEEMEIKIAKLEEELNKLKSKSA